MTEPARHVPEAEILAHLDGELSGEDADRVARHLDRCVRCRRRREELQGADRLFREALERTDVPAPDVGPGDVRAAARERGDDPAAGAGAGPDGAGSRLPAPWGAGLKAALLVLGVATAAAAIPGSPLGSWIADVTSSPAADEAARTTAARAEASPPPQAVSIPVSGRAVVRVVDPGPGLLLRVRLVDAPRLTVEGRGGRYETGDGFVEVRGPGGEELRIDLPRGVGDARVSADGRDLLRTEDGRLRVLASVADSGEAGLVFALEEPAAER